MLRDKLWWSLAIEQIGRMTTKVLQICFGIFLLLPGICSIGFMFEITPFVDPMSGFAMLFWLPSFVISGFGIWLLFGGKGKR